MPRIPCPACGSFNEQYALFCDQCGTPLRGPTPPRPSRGAMWGLLGVLGACAGFLVVFELAFRTQRPERGPSPRALNPNRTTQAFKGRREESRKRRFERERTVLSVETEEGGPAVHTAGEDLSVLQPPPAGPYLEVVSVGRDGVKRFEGLGVLLAGGVLLCPAEAAAGAEELRLKWEGGRIGVTQIAGWDLDRGYCLIRAPLEEPGLETGFLQPGQAVTLVSETGDLKEVTAEQPPLKGLPLVAVSAESVRGAFLVFGDAASSEAVCAGVAWYRWPRNPTPLFGVVGEVVLGEEVALSWWNENVWKRSAYSSLLAGRDAFVGTEYDRAAQLLSDALTKKPAFAPLILEVLVDAYLGWASKASSQGDHEQARTILSSCLEVAGENAGVLLALAREETALQLFPEAIAHVQAAFSLQSDLLARRESLLEGLYLRYSSSVSPDEAVGVLREAAGVLPDSVRVRIELGQVLFQEGRFGEAAAAWEEAYRRSRDPSLASLIEEARRRQQAAEQVVVIPLPETGGTIRATVVVANRLAVPCIVDTGATYTAIPSWAVAELGLSTGQGDRIRIATASGVRSVPVLRVPSVSLGGLAVGPLEVLVLDLPRRPGQPAPGLLGMNFLRHFTISFDRGRGEMRIQPK